MVKIISELEKLGLEMTDEQKEAIKKSIGEEVYSESEHEKKVKKIEAERDGFKKRADTAEETLKGFEGKDFDEITKDRDAWKEKFENLETEQKEAAAKAERANMVADFLKDTVFVNNITKQAITSQLEDALSQDTAKGKSVEDLFNAIVKDKDGNLLPNIIVEESQREAEQRRSQIVGRQLSGQKDKPKLSTAELMKMKNENPNLDISQYI